MTGDEFASRLESIDGRLARIESGFFGDTSLGHHGWVGRLEKLEGLAADAPTLHTEIKQAAAEEANIVREEARRARRELHEKFDAIEDEWKRFKAIAVGIGIGSGLVSAGSVVGLVRLFGG